jgi:hypothetical protein
VVGQERSLLCPTIQFFGAVFYQFFISNADVSSNNLTHFTTTLSCVLNTAVQIRRKFRGAKTPGYKQHKIVILLLLFRYFSVNSFLQFVYFETVLKESAKLSHHMPKKIILLALFIIFYAVTHAQSANWMMGTWKSARATTPAASTIQIDNVSGESFTGTKTSEISNAKITISIAGFVRGKDLYLQNGEVIRKEPESAQWDDCSACKQESKLTISQDSLILRNNISGCANRCDGETFYYRLLSEYDDSVQRYLVDWYGRPADIIGFRPFRPQEDKTVASNDNSEEEKRKQDSLDNIARIKRQQINNAALLAQQKKRQQEIADSINLAQQREQRIKDSLDNVARIRTEDSLLEVQAQKRRQEIADSISLAQQREQRIKDSLDNVARIRQQQIDDSTQLVQQKKREQEIADSISLAQQREQRIKDSLDNVAKLKTEDSLRDAQIKKRQQEITDSLAAMRKQQHNDSLQQAALAKAVPPSTADSVQSAANKALTLRTNVLLETYHITSPDILIELFDNGEIDGDRVSVFHNNTIIVSNQMLGTTPITLNVHADTAHREHEFVLVAENLGSIPPNSALMRITAGKQVYKLSVNTDMKTNARIVFYYDGN